MANRTVKDAKSIKGTNPQYLVEKIIRSRIYDSKYWKEECFALTAELLVDKAMELRFVGGVYGGNVKPTPFLCLTLKMLQIQPEKEIIVEFIRNSDFKYVRALGAYYMRLTGSSLDCFKYLEPLLNDNRKLRRQNREGVFELVYMDEFVDELLREERSCDVILPRIQKRQVLEEQNELQPRTSLLDDDEEEGEEIDDDEEEVPQSHSKSSKSQKEDRSSKKDRGKSSSEKSRRKRSVSTDSSDIDRRHRDRRSLKDRDVRRGGDGFHRRSRSRSRDREYERRRGGRSSPPRDRDRVRYRDRSGDRDRRKDYDRRKRPGESSRKRSRSRSIDRGRGYDRNKKSGKYY